MLYKIVVVATIALSAIAQPYFKTAADSVMPHNTILCTADATCTAQSPAEGDKMLCYTATLTQNAVAAGTGGTVLSAQKICLPSDFADFYTTTTNPYLLIQSSATGTAFDRWNFARVTTGTGAAVANTLTACTTNADCASKNTAGDMTAPMWCCADVVITESLRTDAAAKASTKFCVRDYANAPAGVTARVSGATAAW